MSRQLRSGCSYNALKEPQVPKQKMQQHKAAGAKANANEQALETNSKQLIAPKERERLTFGTAPGERNSRESIHIVGTGKRQGVALIGNNAVKLAPSAYAALTNRAPPIQRVLSWPTPAIKTRMIADAPREGEAAVPRNAEAAIIVPGEQELTPRGANRAPAAVRAPETPSTTTRRKDTSLDNNVNESKSTANYEGLTWDEEVQRVNSEDPGGPNTSLPEISKWVNPKWSWLDYIHKSNQQSAGTNGESVQVNALIFEVDENYVYNNNKYVEVLRNLRNQDQSESTHITVEEIDKETEATETSWTCLYVGKGKGKKKPRERSRKRKRPSLGMALDNLEGLQGERGQPTVSREPSVTYQGGGYLEGLISPSPAQPTMNAENNQETVPRGDRGRARDKPTTCSRRTNPPPSTVELLAPLHGQGGDGERPYTGTPGSDSEPSDSDLSNSDYSSTNKSISSQSTGMTRQQTSRELEDIVRKLRKQNKQLEKKIVTQARSGYKAQTPKAYKGKVDIDKYNMFIFNYKLYLSDTKLSNRKAVLTVSQFLEDKAATWYMMNVAPDPEAYTMETIYVGLYKYCFPPNFKEEVRRQYNQKRQGDLSVQDYFAKLARLRCRLRDINNRQHVLRVWEGTAQYIKVEWALKYMQPETTDLDTLQEAALAAERVHKIKRKIKRLGNNKGNPQKEWLRSPPRKNNHRPNYRSLANGSNGRNCNHRSGSYNGNGNRTDKCQEKNRHKTQEGGRKEANTRKEKLTNKE
ncbi:hypothetical protein RhiTH_008948 [Rhizoctonia solani]